MAETAASLTSQGAWRSDVSLPSDTHGNRIENPIGLGLNLVKRHPLRSVPRLGEERCAATELDQVRRQVPADQNGPRGVGDTPVRVSIIL
jgi:hypothetical protein